MAVEEEEGEPSETSRPPCPAYAELPEVMEHASGRLQLPWERVKKGTGGWLDEWFLSDHNPAAPILLSTKQTAASVGSSMAAMVATERHMWLNMANIMRQFRPLNFSAKARSAVFKTCIQLTSDSGPRQTGGPGPSRVEDQRQAQKSSIASRAPPPPRSRSQRRRDSRKKKDLREVINYRCQQRQ
ncbi:hypothetical protein DPX16_8595 [Anabarilius grahami]|uniref:Uncharacterized protein n=1 Tax=Anabarilius grahami TaxID=495550 RepID=A0A3N0Y9B4_ANAGA|nr:hypothetical protein DPX16_8595 [Anabarilius grahami]